jgi:hypothetical protein
VLVEFRHAGDRFRSYGVGGQKNWAAPGGPDVS